MPTRAERIAAKVRGVAAEKRYTQQNVADALEISRASVVERYAARVPFTAPEILTLAEQLAEPVSRFFPEPTDVVGVEPQTLPTTPEGPVADTAGSPTQDAP